MDGLPPEYYFPDRFTKEADKFFRLYRVETLVGCPSKKMVGLKLKSQRICRFCGKTGANITFKKDAHVFPELIGNKYLISDFECDECNLIFGRYEDNFSKFLGMSRAMLSVKGKEKMPKFKSADARVEVESESNLVSGVTVSANRFTDDTSFSFDENTGMFTVSGKKQSYVPLKTYKALLKMALSCLDEKYVHGYSHAFEFLRTSKFDYTAGGLAQIYKYTFPYSFCYERPVGLIFKKRDPDGRLFTHIFVLFALNGIYELAIPPRQEDMRYFKPGESMSIPLCPPLFTNAYRFPTESIQISAINLSSGELLRDEVDSFSIMRQPGDLIEGAYVHPETGEVLQGAINLSNIKGINFTRQTLPE